MQRLFVVVAITLFAATRAAGQANPSVLAYIEQYKNIAIEEMIRTGVPASITLAQGLLESQAGKSELAIASNNHFGIKCKSNWTGNVYYYDDDAKQECFRSYASPMESFKDHSDFLATRPNYSALFNLAPDDYEGWAKGLKKAGYATNPAYAQRLIKYINDYNLQQFTLLAMNMKKPEDTLQLVRTDIPNNKDVVSFTETTNVQQPLPVTKASETGDAAVAEQSYPEGVFSINQTDVVYAQRGTSLFALASTYNIPYKKLLEYNELSSSDILEDPSLIFLGKKPKRGKKAFHIVQEYETIEAIAQSEGVQLASLMEYNNFIKGKTLQQGEKVYLQPSPALTVKTKGNSR